MCVTANWQDLHAMYKSRMCLPFRFILSPIFVTNNHFVEENVFCERWTKGCLPKLLPRNVCIAHSITNVILFLHSLRSLPYQHCLTNSDFGISHINTSLSSCQLTRWSILVIFVTLKLILFTPLAVMEMSLINTLLLQNEYMKRSFKECRSTCIANRIVRY